MLMTGRHVSNQVLTARSQTPMKKKMHQAQASRKWLIQQRDERRNEILVRGCIDGGKIIP